MTSNRPYALVNFQDSGMVEGEFHCSFHRFPEWMAYGPESHNMQIMQYNRKFCPGKGVSVNILHISTGFFPRGCQFLSWLEPISIHTVVL